MQRFYGSASLRSHSPLFGPMNARNDGEREIGIAVVGSRAGAIHSNACRLQSFNELILALLYHDKKNLSHVSCFACRLRFS